MGFFLGWVMITYNTLLTWPVDVIIIIIIIEEKFAVLNGMFSFKVQRASLKTFL
jgi:hypothetical protein